MGNVPKLRFAEFSGEWEEKLLQEIASFSKGKGISKSDIDENGTLECIRYGELYTTYKEKIEEIKSKTNLSAKNLILSEFNDVIIPASGETQIDIATASCVLKDNVALSGDLNIIKTINNGLFLSYYLNSNKKFDIARLSQGISVVHLYSSQLKTLKLNIPQKQEQEKIASFLSAVDKKIEKIEEKIALQEKYKKAMMQKLFSQEIRFKNDDGSDFPAWEEKKLGDVGKVSMCKRIMKDQTTLKGEIPFYKIGTFGKEADAFISKNLYENYKSKYSFPKKGDVLISASGTIGRLVVYDGLPSYFQDSNIVWISNDEKIIKNKFLKFFYRTVNWNTENTTIARLYNNNLRNIQISIPSLKEQQKIANFLSSLDKKIEATKKQKQKANEFKKGLLQQMFV